MRKTALLLIFYLMQICDCVQTNTFFDKTSNVLGKVSSLQNSKMNWRRKFLEFPHFGKCLQSNICSDPLQSQFFWVFFVVYATKLFHYFSAVYDSGLSNSLEVSVKASQGPNNSNASFTFLVRDVKISHSKD